METKGKTLIQLQGDLRRMNGAFVPRGRRVWIPNEVIDAALDGKFDELKGRGFLSRLVTKAPPRRPASAKDADAEKPADEKSDDESDAK